MGRSVCVFDGVTVQALPLLPLNARSPRKHNHKITNRWSATRWGSTSGRTSSTCSSCSASTGARASPSSSSGACVSLYNYVIMCRVLQQPRTPTPTGSCVAITLTPPKPKPKLTTTTPHHTHPTHIWTGARRRSCR